MIKQNSNIKIIAVGISEYVSSNLPTISGAKRDILNLKKLLVVNPSTALFTEKQFLSLINPDSKQLRELINNTILESSVDNDILIFYFAGHGISIGNQDFGFCTTDTIIHPNKGIALPLSVVKFSEILRSIEIANMIPVFIIDACYSGMIAYQLKIPPSEAIQNIQNQIHGRSASSYALFCACSDQQATYETKNGGIFSRSIVEIGEKGINREKLNKHVLSLIDLYPYIQSKVSSEYVDSIPRLYIGKTLQDFPFIKNIQFKPKKYFLSPSYLKVIKVLWNNGKCRELSPSDISKLCGNSAYCNYNKLCLEPWALIEHTPNSKNIRLSGRGKLFVKGKIRVPRIIIEDVYSNSYSQKDNSELISYKS